MAEIIGAFLESPGEWNLIHKYGRDPSDSSLIHKVLRVNTTGSGFIVAPFAGTLSVKDPGGGQLDGTFPVPGLFDPDAGTDHVFLDDAGDSERRETKTNDGER